MVDQQQVGLGLVGAGNALYQRRHFFQQGVAHRGAVAANGAGHFHGLGDDIGRRTGIERADTNHPHAL